MPPSPSKGQTSPKRGVNPLWIAVQIGDVVNANIEMMPDGVRVTSDSDDPQLILEPTGINSMATHAMTIDFVNFGPPLIEPKIYVDQGDGFDEATSLRPFSATAGRVMFTLTPGLAKGTLRFDPSEAPCALLITCIVLGPAVEDARRLMYPVMAGAQGLVVERLISVRFEGEIAVYENQDPQIHLRPGEGIPRDALWLALELEVEDVECGEVTPRVYIGDTEDESLEPRLIGTLYTFMLALPAFLPSIRLDPASSTGRARIRRLTARAIDLSEVTRIRGDDPTQAAIAVYHRGMDANFLAGIAVAESLRLNRGARRARPSGNLEAGGTMYGFAEGRLTGVIWDPEDPEAPIIEFLANGKVVLSGPPQPPLTYVPDSGLPPGACNFEYQFPQELARSIVSVTARLRRSGAELAGSPFHVGPFAAPPSPIDVRRDAICRDIERRLTEKSSRLTSDGPLISILTPVFNVAEIWLRRMADSVLRQSYGNWELCFVDDGSTLSHVRPVLEDLAAQDPRIVVSFRDQNGGISAASNDALAFANGEYIALVDNDDVLTYDALEDMVRVIQDEDSPDWLYSDEFKIDEEDRVSELFAKPAWSPCMLLNYMYTAHLTFYRTEMVRRLGGFRSEYDFSQDYDLALRMSEVTNKISHVEKYLYGWRMIEGSGSRGGKPAARLSNIAALRDAADRRGWNGEAVPLPTANRLVRAGAGGGALVSIIVPSDNVGNVAATIKSISKTSKYTNFEIIVVTNSRIIAELKPNTRQRQVAWVPYDKAFNFSDKCNAGAEIAQGDYLIFFNDDVRVISPDWIESLLEYLTLPGVGIVGPKLLYENGDIQHAGMVTGVRRLVGTAFHSYPADTNAHFNMAQCVREVSLICGALLAIPAKLFRSVGGFDAINAPVSHSDVDLCLRVREAGYRCVYTPHANLTHIGHMSLTRAEETVAAGSIKQKDKHDIWLLKRFGPAISHDPYFPKAMRDLIYIDSQEDFLCSAPAPSKCRGGPDILIASHELTNSGAPRVAYDMAVALLDKGCFVVVVAPEDGPMRARLEALGVPVLVDATLLHQHEWFVQFAQNFDKVIANTIITWPVVKQIQDAVETHWYIHEAALIDHVADGQPEFRDFLPHAHNVLSISRRTSQYLDKYGVAYTTCEMGVEDLRKMWTPCPRGKKIKIGLFGSFEERKGQDIAAHGFSLLSPKVKARAELHFYGRPLNASFEKSVRELWREETSIYFHGEAPHPQYFERLLEMDVVVLPSRDDPLPLVSLDALALGLTIVCSAATGTVWYMEHGISGYIATDNSAEELRDLFTKMIMDKAAREGVRAGSRRTFEEKFTVAAFRQRLFQGIGLVLAPDVTLRPRARKPRKQARHGAAAVMVTQ
jgi:GT2 family glycosyltransferase